MKRRLLNLLTALSLLPCATATVFSLRGLAAEDMIQYHARGRVVAVQSQRGLIGVITDASNVRGSAWFWEKSRVGENADMVHLFTALYRGTSPAPGFAVVAREPMYVFIAPAWFWLATTGLLASPAAVRVVRGVQRRRRASRNRCPSCGYDLRATPDRCPECGTATPAA